MEIHLLYMAWITAMVFTVLSYYAKNNYSFPIIAGLCWIVSGASLSHVQVIGFDTMGNGHPYTLIPALEITKVGQLAMLFLFCGIGVILFMLTFGWMINQKRVGDEV